MEGVFHIAFTSSNLDDSKEFYAGVLGCTEGRSDMNWIDYNFFGHQLTIQYMSAKFGGVSNYRHPKTGFPLNHFGVILASKDWQQVVDKITASGCPFVVEPQLVMEGEIGEQRIAMIQDPDGNVLEFKTFADLGNVFRSS